MGQAVCSERSSKNIYFDEIAIEDMIRNNSEQSVQSENMKSAKSSEIFSSYSSLKTPSSDKRHCVVNEPLLEQKTVSLKERIELEAARRKLSRERHRDRLVVCALEERRNMQLSNVTRMAENAIQNVTGIMENIADQRESIFKSKDCLLVTEEEVDEVKGITSFRGKVANMMSTPILFSNLNRRHDHDDASDDDASEKLKICHRRSSSVPDRLPSFFGRDRHNSFVYQSGIQKLNKALDALHVQQKDLKDVLDEDKEQLDELGIDTDRVLTKVLKQSRLVKKKLLDY